MAHLLPLPSLPLLDPTGSTRGRKKVKQGKKQKIVGCKTNADTRSRLQIEKEQNLKVERELVTKIRSPKGLAGWLFICTKCKKQFKSSIRATAHAKSCGSKLFRKRKKSIRKMSCNFCGHEECTNAALTKHRLLHHSDRLSKYRCSRCQKQFVGLKSYRRHVAQHGSSQVFTCTVNGCKKSFMTRANMVRHRRNKHLGRFSPTVAGITPLPMSGSEVDGSLTNSSPSSASFFSSPLISDAHSVPRGGLNLTPSSQFTCASGLTAMEEIRNQNVREYAEGFLNLCSEMGDSSQEMRATSRIFESRIIPPNQPAAQRPPPNSSSTTNQTQESSPPECPPSALSSSSSSSSSIPSPSSFSASTLPATRNSTGPQNDLETEVDFWDQYKYQTYKCILCGFISEGFIYELYEHLEEQHGMERAGVAELEKCCIEVGEEEDSARGGSPLSPAGSPFSVLTTHSKSSSTASQTREPSLKCPSPTFKEPIPHSSSSASPTPRSASRAPGVDESLTAPAPEVSSISLANQTSQMGAGLDELDLGPASMVSVGTQTSASKFNCEICGFDARDGCNLRQHIKSMHKPR